MPRSSTHHASVADGAAAAALVAPLLKLRRAGDVALQRGRFVRVIELRERELAAAQASLPRDSFIIACLMDSVVGSRTTLHMAGDDALSRPEAAQAAFLAAWRDDARALPLSRDALAIYHARWRAGTLLAPREEERAYFAHAATPAELIGGEIYKNAAAAALDLWPPLRAHSPEDDARLHAVHGALQAVLTLRAGGHLERWPRVSVPLHPLGSVTSEEAFALIPLQRLLWCVLHGGGALLPRLRAECGLQRGEEEALRARWRCARLCHASATTQRRSMSCCGTAWRRRDSPPPRTWRATGCAPARCRSASRRSRSRRRSRCAADAAPRATTLRSAAHQQQDWRRHKRADGCAAAAAAGQ
jgi:hypothetical protein